VEPPFLWGIQLEQKSFFAIESRFKNQRIYERRRHGVFSPFIFWNAFLKTETPTDSQPLSREERFFISETIGFDTMTFRQNFFL
jgi:hypothetical protein